MTIYFNSKRCKKAKSHNSVFHAYDRQISRYSTRYIYIYIYIYIYPQVVMIEQNLLTFSHYPSLSAIVPGRSSSQNLVSVQS